MLKAVPLCHSIEVHSHVWSAREADCVTGLACPSHYCVLQDTTVPRGPLQLHPVPQSVFAVLFSIQLLIPLPSLLSVMLACFCLTASLQTHIVTLYSEYFCRALSPTSQGVMPCSTVGRVNPVGSAAEPVSLALRVYVKLDITAHLGLPLPFQ